MTPGGPRREPVTGNCVSEVCEVVPAADTTAGVESLVVVAAEPPLPPHPTRAAAITRTPSRHPRRKFTRVFISILRTVTSHCAYVPVGKGCLNGGAVRGAQGASGPVFREVSQLIAAKLRAFMPVDS
jgi:hypothetical protein